MAGDAPTILSSFRSRACCTSRPTVLFLPVVGGYCWVGDPDRGFGTRQPGGWCYNVLPYLEHQDLHDLGQACATQFPERRCELGPNDDPAERVHMPYPAAVHRAARRLRPRLLHRHDRPHQQLLRRQRG